MTGLTGSFLLRRLLLALGLLFALVTITFWIDQAIFYDPTAQSFSAEVSEVKALDPDAIVLIGFDESAKVVDELVKQGIGPNSE